MARDTGPKCRLCRRAGEKLFLKGERCFTPKCAIERRRQAPGDHPTRRRRGSDWGIQLREKQKAKVTYGVLERQFQKYFEEALKKPGVTGQYLLQILECRMDNVVYRLNMAESRAHARQMVRHGHFTINGRRANTPSMQLKAGDVLAWKESSTKKDLFKLAQETVMRRAVPEWLGLDPQNMAGKVLRLPEPRDIESLFDTRLVVEFYSR